MAQLVDMSPFSFAFEDDHKVFVGRKEILSSAVELETGRVDLERMYSEDEDNGAKLAQILLGRTDYHVHVLSRCGPVPVQTLSFSTYGPAELDNPLQASYRRSKDQTYIQSLPGGQVVSLKINEGNDPSSVSWAHKFSDPIVATFDVLRTTKRAFALLQPLPPLRSIFSKVAPHLDEIYVGLVGETLFASHSWLSVPETRLGAIQRRWKG
ncbi:hypothetical protein FB45DRAFT_40677 [Roridomyces roridus]|uniref:Uncharacterized protein n=1 Tax=Roridomyces roridus TaxID=1738132 RepID=A0AAD7FN41_9AGAR|nr:hypothetical protein FB45DRAFT_40677 [Roridomyces roridus]